MLLVHDDFYKEFLQFYIETNAANYYGRSILTFSYCIFFLELQPLHFRSISLESLLYK